MNSKEALERYYSNLLYGCGGFSNDNEELEALNVIKQDLERLEKLEKVIEILKEYGGIDLWKSGTGKHFLIECGYYNFITKEEYVLLKEILENENM